MKKSIAGKKNTQQPLKDLFKSYILKFLKH